jgi:hypothetical protein
VASDAAAKKRNNIELYAVVLGLACWLASSPAWAQTAHVENHCPRLTPLAFEELDARVLLLLSGAVRRPPPAVVCTKSKAWVEWDGKRFPILGKAPIADEVLDIIEAELQAESTSTPGAEPTSPTATSTSPTGAEPAPASSPDPPAPPAPLPAVAVAADRRAVRPADARGGGIALGIETELPSDTISTALGPSFDFAASVGPILLGGREAIRFSVAGRRVSLMDFQAAVFYGAPFDPAAHVGAVARFGAEWLVAYPEGNSGQAKVAPVTDLGLRLASSFGMVGLWFGVDAHFRLTPLALRSRGTLAANDIGGSFTLGAAFVDWSRK